MGIELAGLYLFQLGLVLDDAVEERLDFHPQLLVLLLELCVYGQQLLVVAEGLEDVSKNLLLAG